MNTQSDDVTPRRHHLVQAPVPPLDEDGALALGVGTIAFAVAAVVVRGWWQHMTLAGAGMGVLALAYVLQRRRRVRRQRSATSPR